MSHVEGEPDYQRLLEFRTGLRRFLRWSVEQAAAVELTPAQHQLLLRHHSTVGLIDRAETAGLVRLRDVEDHRLVRLRLTALGQRRIEQLSATHSAELARYAPRLRRLWEGLDTMVSSLWNAAVPRPPRGHGRACPR